ncbi:MAG: hypothetical protein J6033_07250, partial [Lachnospiraceae bacterium]|nr:hypothetical protein [Lachnospiraceae bacterium]
GMESATYHRSVITRTTTFAIKDYQTDLDQNKEAKKDEERSDKSDNEKSTLPERLWGLKTDPAAGARIRGNSGNLAETFRQEVIKYIYSLLFMDRPKKAFEDMEGMELNRTSYGQEANNGFSYISTGLSEKTTVTMYEYREMSFNTKGTVKCADGRTIDFNLNVSASKEFYAKYEHEVNWGALNFADPLVINLDGDVADVADVMVRFDLDSDGEAENIRNIASGSGFLALDLNDNGTIDNGTELFGAKSGNGFADLSKYDEDGNGWIDEGDAVFDKLKILYLDSEGRQRTYSLAEKGVGALSLYNLDSPYELGDITNTAKGPGGIIRKTGFFLYENGNAGTLQQVDLQTNS